MSGKRRVCVIGAGTAGLSALKNSLQHNLDAVCYEQGKELGGTWLYEDREPNFDFEDDVHSSMYQGLRTNLPKEVMGYPDFPYPENLQESFVPSEVVLQFLQSYADHFQLRQHIEFQHEVIRVRPRTDDWEVYVWDHINDRCYAVFFDFLFVCNGHFTTPKYPQIEGMDIYRGRQMHSHLYRKPNKFKAEKVLIIGAGPSGMDLTNLISKEAKHVFLSHHLQPPPPTHFMRNVTQKPDVERFTKDGAIFKDGSSEDFSFVIYCTGYKYSFPFLSSECGLLVRNHHVQPLYKHCINVNFPTMAIIGLPFMVLPTQSFDLQVRFALKYFTNQRKLPSREEMLAELESEMKERLASGLTECQAHQMGEKQFSYYKDLSELAGITNIKPVVEKMIRDCGRKYIYEMETYRQYRFKVVDDENFIKYSLD